MNDQLLEYTVSEDKGKEAVKVISDESNNKHFSPIAVTHLVEALRRGVDGKLVHSEERKKIAISLNTDVCRVTVDDM